MNSKVTIFCDGGCGRSVTLRRSRIRPADYYLCASRADGDRCRGLLPARPPGQIVISEYNAAAGFTGITYRIPDEEERVAVARAKRLKRFARGVPDRAELRVIKNEGDQ